MNFTSIPKSISPKRIMLSMIMVIISHHQIIAHASFDTLILEENLKERILQDSSNILVSSSLYSQARPVIEYLEQDQVYAVCWVRQNDLNLTYAVFIKFYDVNGVNFTDEIRLSNKSGYNQQRCSLAAIENGTKVGVTFVYDMGDRNDLVYMLFNSRGLNLTSDIIIPIQDDNVNFYNSIKYMSDISKILLTFHGFNSTIRNAAISCAILNIDGTLYLPRFYIETGFDFRQPQISYLEKGIFGIVYINFTFPYRSYFKIYNLNNNLTDRIDIGGHFHHIKIESSIRERIFTLTWAEYNAINYQTYQTWLQIYNIDGTNKSNLINAISSQYFSNYLPEIKLFDNDTKIVLISSYSQPMKYDVYMKIFSINGSNLTDVIQVSSDTNMAYQLFSGLSIDKYQRKALITWPFGSNQIYMKLVDICMLPIDCKVCYFDSQCGINAPICYNGACTSEIMGSIVSNKSIIFEDDTIILSFNFVKEFPYNVINYFQWRCIRSFHANQYTNCSDSFGLFSLNSMDNILTIPSSYFSQIQGNQTEYMFKLYVSNTWGSKTFEYNFTVFSRIRFGSLGYFYYAISSDYTLSAYTFDDNFKILSNLRYNWTLSPQLNFTSLGNKITIYKTNDDFSILNDSLSVTVIAFNGSYQRSQNLLIPINKLPYGGRTIVLPRSGNSLTTQYSILAESWTDIDQPLKYKFSYSYDLHTFIILRDYDFNSQIQTILPGNINSDTVYIQIEVMDSFGAFIKSVNSTICYSSITNILESNAVISSALDSLNNTNLTDAQKKAALEVISNQFVTLETQYQSASNNSIAGACPACSGHGTCPSVNCVCDSSWSYFDCSMSSTVMNQILSSKMKILDTLTDLLSNPLNLNDSSITGTIKLVGSNPDFNSFSIYSKIQDILQTYLKVDDPTTILTKPQADDVSKIVDSTFQYLSSYDCSSSSLLANNTASKSAAYINTIGRSIMNSDLATQNQSVISEESFSLYVAKVSACDLNSTKLSTGASNSPDVVLNINSQSYTQNCSKMINVQYLALDSNLLSCNFSSPKIFSNIAVSLYDSENGSALNLLNSLTLQFKTVDSLLCDSSCSKSDLQCLCGSIGIFDIKNQFTNLFKRSQLNNLVKFGALADAMFTKSGPFIILLLYFLLSIGFMIFIRRWNDYDITDKIRLQECKKSKRVVLLYLVVQPLLKIIFFKDEISKSISGFLYYSRIVLTLMHVSLFGLKDYSKDETLSQNISNFTWINPYLLILPYFTILPLYAIFNLVIRKYWINSVKINQAKRILSLGVIFLAILIFNIFIIVITANLSSEMQNQWVFNFGFLQFQEIFIYPLVGYLLFSLKFFWLKKKNPVERIKWNMILNDVDDTILKLRFHESLRKNSVIKRRLRIVSDNFISNRERIRISSKKF